MSLQCRYIYASNKMKYEGKYIYIYIGRYIYIYVQIVNIYIIYIYTHKYMCAHLRIAIPPAAL